MAAVNERFAAALKARLDGAYGEFFQGNKSCDPPSALRLGVPEETVAQSTAEAMEVEFAQNLSVFPTSYEFLQKIPIAFARQHRLIGLASDNGCITVALCDLRGWMQLEAIAKVLGKTVRPVLATHKEITRAINSGYQSQSGQTEQVIQELDQGLGDLRELAGKEDLLDVAGRAPVIKLVNLLLLEAVKRRASDVHVQPYEDRLVVRFRVDGILHDVYSPPKTLQSEIVSRVKVMGGMNIAERRLAQDGRATVAVGDRRVDLRIATLPTNFGERAVIRLLDKSARIYGLTELGMPESVLESFRRLIHLDHGIILVTGPTGSGKSTTLYAALQEINSKHRNILTLEDPIEYSLDGISQTQVSDRKGMTFVSGLRHVLRQDPDIIMVGEIRDADTARMAIQSALTGHLVFSTLHTNDAAGAVARMLDLGVEPYLLASSLLGALAQRLVRRICPHCRRPHKPTQSDRKRWGFLDEELTPREVFHGRGCPGCLETGYMERVGIFELLTITELIRELILQRAKASSIKALALDSGMTTLRGDGMAKVFAGVTTMDEVARVTGRDEF